MPNDDLGQFPLPKNPAPSDDNSSSTTTTSDDAVQMPDINDLFPPHDNQISKDTALTPNPSSETTTTTPPESSIGKLDDWQNLSPEAITATPSDEPEISELSNFDTDTPPISNNKPDTPQTESPSISSIPKITNNLPTFEETPDEIPSFSNPTLQTTTEIKPEITSFEPTGEDLSIEPETITPSTETTPPIEDETLINTSEPITQNPVPKDPKPATPATHTPSTPELKPEPIPAVLPTSNGPNMKIVTFISLFVVALISVAAAAFFFQRSRTLNQNLKDVTGTLEKQETLPTTTPTPTIIEYTEQIPTTTPIATPTATITPISTVSATPTLTMFESGSPLMPLSITPEVLKIAIKHQPNAQLLLVKSENAQDQNLVITKYFFRNSLSDKKYFYITITPGKEPTIFTDNVYVTPDNDIPSLNNGILQNKLGIDLAEATQIAKNLCPPSLQCNQSVIKAQYMTTSSNQNLWQITLNTSTAKDPLIVQINALTKDIIFKSEVLNTATPTP